MQTHETNDRVLITGGAGFIGKHLRQFLKLAGYDIHYISRRPTKVGVGHEHVCDLLNAPELSNLLSEINPQFIIHLAALAVPNRNLSDLEEHYINTVQPALNLARVAPANIKLSIFFGSCEEYGNGLAPFREHDALHAISPYGWAKIMAFHGSKMIAEQRGFPWCWVRPFLCFGADQHSDAVIPTLIKGCLQNQKIPLTQGAQTRDFMYVADLCTMVHTLMQTPQLSKGQIVNLATGIPRTIRSVAKTIQRFVGAGTLDFGAKPYRENEIMSFYGSTEKFTGIFGEQRFSNFDDSLQTAVDFYR